MDPGIQDKNSNPDKELSFAKFETFSIFFAAPASIILPSKSFV